MKQYVKISRVLFAILACAPSIALASTIVFQGQNAALFPGANPAANALLLQSTNKPNNTGVSTSTTPLSNQQIIEQSVLTAATAKLENQIFGGGSGSQDLGGGHTVSWTTDPTTHVETVTFNDNGQITSIQFQSN